MVRHKPRRVPPVDWSRRAVDMGIYVSPFDGGDATYVGDWAIDSDRLYHRHPGEVGYDFDGADGVKEYDVNDKVCWECEARCPDGVWMAHRLLQL